MAGYGGENPKNSLELVGCGEGGVEDFASQFNEDIADKIRFGYVRVVSLCVCVCVLVYVHMYPT